MIHQYDIRSWKHCPSTDYLVLIFDADTARAIAYQLLSDAEKLPYPNGPIVIAIAGNFDSHTFHPGDIPTKSDESG